MQLLSLYAYLALTLAVAANPLIVRDDSATCDTPLVVSTQTAQVGNNTVVLEKLTCPTSFLNSVSESSGLVANSLGGGSPNELCLGNILCDLLPIIFCPPKPYNPKPPPPPKTTYKTTVKPTTVTKTIVTATTDTKTKVITTTVTQTIPVTVTPTPTPTPTPVDVCGEICDVSCGGEIAGQVPPTDSDCQVIVESIQVFAGNSAPTFVVEPLHIQQLTFGTCRFFFENLGTEELEYCWSDLANMGSLAATSCFPPVQPQNTLGICQARDTTWEVGVSHA